MKKIYFVLILIFGFTGNLNAENNFYVGGGMGSATFDGKNVGLIDGSSNISFANLQIDSTEDFNFTDLNSKIFGGFRISKYSAVEIGFHNFEGGKGKPSEDLLAIFNDLDSTSFDAQDLGTSIDTLGLSVSLLAIIPISKTFEVFAKVGVLHSWVESNPSKVRQVENIEALGAELGTGGTTETGFAVLFGAGASYKFTDNLSLRGEIEYAPNVANNHSHQSEKIFAEINRIRFEDGLDGNADYDFDADILSTTASIIWNF